MNIKFKDGKEIEFKPYGNIWLANSVIWEGIDLQGSLDKLRELKAKIAEWFEKNAPDEIKDKYNARLPLWGEILTLPFKYIIVYRKGKTNETANYILGDEEGCTSPILCTVAYSGDGTRWFTGNTADGWSGTHAVRLCLEEKR